MNLMLDEFILDALKEDIGTGDITTLSTVDEDAVITGQFITKQDCILCGLDIVTRVFALLDARVQVDLLQKEGAFVQKGIVLARISGPARSILTGERVALNILQHLSGIATRTKAAVDSIRGTKAVIADTRKTTPGLRVLEKYAVRVGGGSNHRFNLSDGILIKDNHIRAAGGITAAVQKARKAAPHTLKIEVEVETLAQLEEALACKVDIIMLDNMSIADMKHCVMRASGKVLLEASGNMGEKDLRAVAETGVDIISIGALTHSVQAADISLKF